MFSSYQLARVAACVVGFLAPMCAAQVGGRTPKRPNVLFIAVDDLKPLMGCYGGTLAHTPEMDKLAARGTVFTKAYCQWPVCGPSRASLLTSQRPEASGVMDLKTDVRAKKAEIVTLPQHFRLNGYVSAGVGKIHDPRCVDNKKDCDKPSWSLPFVTPKARLVDGGGGEDGKGEPVTGAPECEDADTMDGQIALAAGGLLRQLARQEQPFFLAVGFKKPHLPFVAPRRYWDLYQRATLPLASHQGGIERDSGYALHESGEFRGYGGVPKEGALPEALQRECIHGYLACVSLIDAQIGALMRELETQGLRENTIVVLWGDHGFHLGDHGMWGKHSTLENAARVPLVIVTPGGSKVPATDAPVEFTDIFPTLCTLAGLPVPEQAQGRSLAPLMQKTGAAVREGALTVFKNKGAVGYSYRTARHRYTEWVNKFGKTVATDLFDYEADPMEKVNLAREDASAPVAARLAAALRKEAQGCELLFLHAPPPSLSEK